MTPTTVNPNKDWQENTTISSATISGAPEIAYQSPTPTTPYPVASLIDAAGMPQETAPERQANDLTTQLQGLNNRLVGESAFRTQQENSQDITGLNKSVTDLSSQLTGLANESLALQNEAAFTIPNQSQVNAEGRGVTARGLAPITAADLRRNQIKQGAIATQALTIKSALEAAQGRLANAKDMVDRAVKSQFDPVREEIAAATANLKLILESPAYSLADKKRAAQQMQFQDDRKRALDTAEQNRRDVLDIGLQAAKLNADPETIRNIQNSATPEEALTYAGSVLGQEFVIQQQQMKFDNDLKLRQMRLSESNAALDQAKFAYQKMKDAADKIDNASFGNITDLNKVLSSGKVGQGTKTQVANVLGVINSVSDLAIAHPDGKFAGFNPIAGRIPNALSSKDAITNRGYLDAINLKVQQWASGASLTAQQIAQVNKMTPTKDDTDRIIQAKLNSLTNFMHTQVKSQLQSEGIVYEPAKVDLFAQQKSLEDIFNE